MARFSGGGRVSTAVPTGARHEPPGNPVPEIARSAYDQADVALATKPARDVGESETRFVEMLNHFTRTLEQSEQFRGMEQIGFDLHEVCLVLETPHENLVERMWWLQGIFANRFNDNSED